MKIVSHSPQSPTDIVIEVEGHSAEDVASVIATARIAQSAWWQSGATARANALTKAADLLAARSAEFAALITREVGKPVAEATGEVGRAVAILRYYAQASFAAKGDFFPPSASGLLWSERRPHGVAGLITPWNFPIAIPLWKAAPALAAGNAVVLKPSPDAVGCASLLAELMAEALGQDLFNIVLGGPEVGSALVAAADVVSFTGSSAVGRQVARAAAERGVPVQAEMGGQNAAIVLADADPHRTAAMIVGASMWFAGQKCTCTRRVITVGEQPEFVSAFLAAVAGLQVADPASAGVMVGPLINEAAVAKFEAAIESAKQIGAEAHQPATNTSAGHFVPPTVLTGVPADHPLACDEVFGPLVTLHVAKDLDEAVAMANSVPYGLVGSVHGRDHDSLLKAAEGLHTGLVKVNAPTTGVDFYAPFGGEKASSIGPREQGMTALDFYSTTRTVTYAPHG